MGWFLGFLSQEFNDRRSRKRGLGKLLAKLIILEGQVRSARSAVAQITQAQLPRADQEIIRSQMLSRNFMEGSASLEALSPLIEESAGFRPIAAVRLQRTVSLLHGHKTTSFEEISQHRGAIYERQMAIYEAAFELLHKELRNICRSYALSFSF